MLDLRTAVERVLRDAQPLDGEVVPIEQAAGRVLAADVPARRTLPAADDSAMDGYAVRAADVGLATATVPVRLPVAGTIAAGARSPAALAPGQAMRIMTGAPMPAGADCVVRIEDTDGGTDVVEIRDARDVGRNVRPQGEDVRRGAVALGAGNELHPGALALLAALGERTVPVHRRPRVALLSSGDELVPLQRATLGESEIVASNAIALAAAFAAAGAEIVDLGIAADDPRAIAERAAGAAGCDLLVTTGGASVGAFDYTQRALADLGLELDFWRVAVRPGAQTAFGRLREIDGLPWLGLPGNPVSAQVTGELFVRPLLRRWGGHALQFRSLVPVTVSQAIRTSGRARFLLRVRLRQSPTGPVASLTGAQGSNLLTSMARADALLVVPDGVREIAAGGTALALPLRDGWHQREIPW